jgi:hypothetical protein
VCPASGAIDRESERFGDEGRHALRVSVSVSYFEYEVAPDNVSQVSKSLTETSVAHIVPAGTDPNVSTLGTAGFCERAARGHPTIVPQRRVIKSRRFIRSSRRVCAREPPCHIMGPYLGILNGVECPVSAARGPRWVKLGPRTVPELGPLIPE